MQKRKTRTPLFKLVVFDGLLFLGTLIIGLIEGWDIFFPLAEILILLSALCWALGLDMCFVAKDEVIFPKSVVLRLLIFFIFLDVWVTFVHPVPGLLASRHRANETSAIGTLRAIFSAQEQFRILKKKKGAYGTFEELKRSGIFGQLDKKMQYSGYIFKMNLTSDLSHFEILADPVFSSKEYKPTSFRSLLEKLGRLEPLYTGKRRFWTSDQGNITFTTDGTLPGSASEKQG